MTTRDWTTTSLLADIRRLGSFADEDTSVPDADLLAIATSRMMTSIVPLVQTVNEGYWRKRLEVPVVSQQRNYRIPSRAIGGVIDKLFYNRNTQDDLNDNIFKLDQLTLQDGVEFYFSPFYSSTGLSTGFHIEGDEIFLTPIPPASTVNQAIIFVYPRTPNELVQTGTSDVDTITVVGSTTSVTVATNANFPDGSYTVDVIQANPNFDSLADDVSATKSGTTITLGTAVEGMQTGDFVCLAGKSPVPQIPREFHHLLAISAAEEALRQRKDFGQMQALQQDFEKYAEMITGMLTPRVRNEPMKIIARNSALRSRNQQRYRWRF